MQSVGPQPTAPDLRSDLARLQLRIYDIAPLVGMHPARLGQVLRGKLPLSPQLAERIRAAIHHQGGVEAR
jgi:plasmid maintenance system antidote protein VapI